MSEANLKYWEAKYAAEGLREKPPEDFLRENAKLFPGGKALEIACGAGHNALFLAEHGYQVDAFDISPTAIKYARELAAQRGTKTNFFTADVDSFSPPENSCDLVLLVKFVLPEIYPLMERAVKSGGLLCYQAFNHRQLVRNPEFNPAFTLADGVIGTLFPSCETLYLSERSGEYFHLSEIICRKR